MSWTAEAVVISGYQLSNDLYNALLDYCEHNWQTESLPQDWEDYFIDCEPFRVGTEKTLFFGSIIYTVDEYSAPIEFESILAHGDIIFRTQELFLTLCEKAFPNGFPVDYEYPTYSKYLALRWT